MKCGSRIRGGGSCGNIARWKLNGREYCVAHARVYVFDTVSNRAQRAVQEQICLDPIDEAGKIIEG